MTLMFALSNIYIYIYNRVYQLLVKESLSASSPRCYNASIWAVAMDFWHNNIITVSAGKIEFPHCFTWSDPWKQNV